MKDKQKATQTSKVAGAVHASCTVQPTLWRKQQLVGKLTALQGLWLPQEKGGLGGGLGDGGGCWGLNGVSS